VGRQEATSNRSRGLSPGWLDEVLILTEINLLSSPNAPAAPPLPGAELPRMRLTVSVGKPRAGPLVPGAALVSGAVSGAASVVSGAASVLTLGNVQLGGGSGGGGGGGAALKLHSRGGGLLGRQPRSRAEAAAEADAPEQSDSAFAGAIEPLSLRELMLRCDVAHGPVTLTLPLLEVPSGRIDIIVEVCTFHCCSRSGGSGRGIGGGGGGDDEKDVELPTRTDDVLAGQDVTMATEFTDASRPEGDEPCAVVSIATVESSAAAVDSEIKSNGCHCSCFG
jgi:hypothetical protein